MVKPFWLTYLANGGSGCQKFVNICEMHGIGGLEVVMFDRFQRYVEIVRKSNEKVLQLFHQASY